MDNASLTNFTIEALKLTFLVLVLCSHHTRASQVQLLYASSWSSGILSTVIPISKFQSTEVSSFSVHLQFLDSEVVLSSST